MKDFSVTKQKDAIEVIFAEPFSKLKQHEISTDEMRFYVQLFMAQRTGFDVSISEEEKPFLYKVMEKRIDFCFTYTLSERVLAFLSLKCKSVGTAIMYFWYFQYLSKKHNLNKFDMSDLSEYFPNGFPSEDDLSELWREQKVKRPANSLSSDNLLDYSSAGESILNLN